MSNPFPSAGGAASGFQTATSFAVVAGSNPAALSIANADTELTPAMRLHVDLTGYSQFAMDEGHTAGTNAGTKLYFEYSLDGGTTWVHLDGTPDGNAPTAYVDITTASILNPAGGPISWYNLHAAARTEVIVRALFRDGGATSYTLRNVRLWVR